MGRAETRRYEYSEKGTSLVETHGCWQSGGDRLAAGIREHLAGSGAAGGNRHTGADNIEAFMGSKKHLLKSHLKTKSRGF